MTLQGSDTLDIIDNAGLSHLYKRLDLLASERTRHLQCKMKMK